MASTATDNPFVRRSPFRSTETSSTAGAQVVFTFTCLVGTTPASNTFTVSKPNATFEHVGDAWYPSGDQHDPSVYQSSVMIGSLHLCPTATSGISLARGGVFSADPFAGLDLFASLKIDPLSNKGRVIKRR